MKTTKTPKTPPRASGRQTGVTHQGKKETTQVQPGKSPVKSRLFQHRILNLSEPPKGYYLVLGCLFVLFVVYETLLSNYFLLWKLHDQAIFITDLTYFNDCLQAVGGLSVYIATFLNQFFLYPLVGTLIFTTTLMLVVWMTHSVFNLKGWRFPLAFIPSLLLVLALTQNGYMMYLIKLEGFIYVSVVGVIIALCGALLGKLHSKTILLSFIAAIYGLVAYSAAGIYGLFGCLLFAVFSAKQAIALKHKYQLIPAIVAILVLILTPQLLNRWVYDTTMQSLLYLTNLPNYYLTPSERLLWLPYILLGVFVLIASLLTIKSGTMKNKWKVIYPLALLLLTGILVEKASFQDQNFTTELAMRKASEQGEWNKVLKLAKKSTDEPTRLIVMFTNMALFKLGLQGDVMYHYKDGNKAPKMQRPIADTEATSPFFYFNYGKLNYCYKWCMEDAVEYGLSPLILKYFVLSSLLNGENKLATKYNRLLSRTLLHKNEAKHFQRYMDDSTLIKRDPLFTKVLPLTQFENFLGTDHARMESYLRDDFSNTVGGPPEMVELCLLFNMEIRNRKVFWPAFFNLVQSQQKIPTHIQEAALLFNHIDKTNYIDPSRFDPNVINRFNQFLTLLRQYPNLSIEEAKPLYEVNFKDTYWFYFSFIKNHTSDNKSQKENSYSS